MALTVEQYKQLSGTEQKAAMKEIQSKLASMTKQLDSEFDELMTQRLPSKIMALHQLSRTLPSLFKNTPRIKVQESPSNRPQSTVSSRARKRRKVTAQNTKSDGSDPRNSEIEIWRTKSARSASELQRLRTAVDCNESMVSMSNMLSREILEMLELTASLKMALSLKVPAMMEGNNFGVDIQDGVIDDLCRAENGALDAADQIASYFQIRSKAISKVLKWPKVEDYRIALSEFDASRLSANKSMAVDLGNSYLILHDSIAKNKDKLLNPRDQRSKFYLY